MPFLNTETCALKWKTGNGKAEIKESSFKSTEMEDPFVYETERERKPIRQFDGPRSSFLLFVF